MRIFVVELKEVTGLRLHLFVFEVEGLEVVSLDLQPELLVVAGVPAMICVRVDLLVRGYASDQNTAQVIGASAQCLKHHAGKCAGSWDLFNAGIPDAGVLGLRVGYRQISGVSKADPYIVGLAVRGSRSVCPVGPFIPELRVIVKLHCKLFDEKEFSDYLHARSCGIRHVDHWDTARITSLTYFFAASMLKLSEPKLGCTLSLISSR